jgi:hypothetical protein
VEQHAAPALSHAPAPSVGEPHGTESGPGARYAAQSGNPVVEHERVDQPLPQRGVQQDDRRLERQRAGQIQDGARR